MQKDNTLEQKNRDSVMQKHTKKTSRLSQKLLRFGD